jgi:hypothetical protein
MARAWDLAAYGYTGPRREEPKAEAGLTEDIRGLIGEEVAAQLREAVAPGTEDTAPAEPVEDPAPEAHADDPIDPEEPAAEPEPADEWTALTAHLTPDDDDTWSALVSNLTEPDASSSAATA